MRLTQGRFLSFPISRTRRSETDRVLPGEGLVDRNRIHRRSAPAELALGDVEPPDVRHEGPAGDPARSERLPEGVPFVLHQGQCEQLHAGPRDGGALLHRQPARAGARFPDGPPGGRRTNGALHAARIRRGPARPARATTVRSDRLKQSLRFRIAVDVGAAAREASIDETLRSLDAELVGLKPVKLRIRQTAALLLVERLREQAGLSAEPPSLHMCFTGNPGTGKTTVALRMAEDPAPPGLRAPRPPGGGHARRPGGPICRPHRAQDQGGAARRPSAECCSSTRRTTCTAPKTSAITGQEAIEILLQFMENRRDDLVVILAGYKDKMDKLLPVESGAAFAHRAPHRFSRLHARRN